jgi:hypothetical protein
MSPDDRIILEHTAISPTLLMCPLRGCGYNLEVPAIPKAGDRLANIFGMTGATFDQVHAEAIAADKAADMRRHLQTHTPEQWLTFAGYLVQNAVPRAFLAAPLQDTGASE